MALPNVRMIAAMLAAGVPAEMFTDQMRGVPKANRVHTDHALPGSPEEAARVEAGVAKRLRKMAKRAAQCPAK